MKQIGKTVSLVQIYHAIPRKNTMQGM